MKKTFVYSPILLAVLSVGASRADELCEAAQLTAVGQYCQSLLTCEANLVANPDKDPQAEKWTSCVDKVNSVFGKSYDKALVAADKRDQQCAYQPDADTAGKSLYEDVLSLSENNLTGWVPEQADNHSAYKNISAAVAASCKKIFGIEAGFARTGKVEKRDKDMAAANKALQTKLDKLIAQTRFDYVGLSSEKLVDGLAGFNKKWVKRIRPDLRPDQLLSLTGSVLLAEALSIDGDNNDPNMAYLPNDSFENAQSVFVPTILGGYVNRFGFGAPGPSTSAGDEWDVYKVTFAANQIVNLTIGDGVDFADLDLYLYAGNCDQVDRQDCQIIAQSDGASEYESITVPAAGDYFVGVYAYEGASNYVLSFGQQLAEQTVPLRAEFVPGEIIVRMKGQAAAAATATAAGKQAAAPAPAALAQTYNMQALRGVPQREMLWKLSDDAEERNKTFTALGVKAPTKQPAAAQAAAQATDNDRLKQDTLVALTALRARPDVASADLNYIRRATAVPNDPYYKRQWHYPMISLPAAWDATQGEGAIVAVVDTGVLLDHPDLQGRLVAGYDFIANKTNANDGNGIDANAYDPGDSPNTGSHSYHGTHVAGTIAASSNNGKGVSGVAWNAKIMPLRVLGVDGGTDYDIGQAVRFAAGLSNDSGTVPAKRADVINLSLGGAGSSSSSQLVFNEARAAGVIVVAAAGNESTSEASYPAAYNGVVSVSAVDTQKKLAPYSNYGSTIDVAAPGGDTSRDRDGDGFSDGIWSTLATGDSKNENLAFNYDNYQGTSMATPHVAGVVALMRSLYPQLTPAQFDTLLGNGQISNDIGNTGRDNSFGHGLINARLAVEAAQNLAGGGELVINPVLNASPSGLNFGNKDNSLSLNLSNGGGGKLTIATLQADQPWVSIQSTSVDADGLGAYAISIDRSGLDSKAHSATLTVVASTGQFKVPILVGGSSAESTAGPNYYLLINTETEEIIQLDVQEPVAGVYYLSFEDVPEGRYTLLGGTDMDNDTFICDGGELCGGYPSIEQLQDIVVDQNLSGIDFTANFSQSLQIVSAAVAQTNVKLAKRLSAGGGIARKPTAARALTVAANRPRISRQALLGAKGVKPAVYP